MIRIVLAESEGSIWRIYRQEQWMALVRREPTAALWPRSHYDVDEDAFLGLVKTWEEEASGSSRESATRRLREAGALVVTAV